MKIKITIAIIIISIFSLTSCSNEKQSILILSEIPSNAQIICYDDEKIYYSVNDKEDGYRNLTLFLYDIQKKRNFKLAYFSNTDYIITDIVPIKNDIYLINKDDESEYSILKINTQDQSVRAIYKWSGNISFNYLFNIDQNLVLMNINTLDDGITNRYTIDLIDINTLQAKQIVKKECNRAEGIGTIISSICVDNNSIYSFENVEDNGKTEFYIVQYDIEGNEINSHKLDLNAFLKPDDSGIYSDAVVDIYINGDYYILSTLNQRKIIYKKEDNKLVKIKIPSELYSRYPSRYRILPFAGETNEAVYFVDAFSDIKVLIAFNKEGRFYYVKLPIDTKDYPIIYRNSKGDLLIQSTSEYYLLHRDNMCFKSRV
ncbi:hypothetical protein [Aminipila terrae]|uniref:Lipoprotein n=1 Tax=Aminipila terrae TaxID=2697030 RepID=A0A6P1MB08_9FIRM|nr:hypothetical protein [Aminipila terrae]QHI71041.1 hypothetical protein Ami3637_00365 [Aminipila terrae]